MDLKKIIIFLFALIIVAVLIIGMRGTKIESVIDGSTVRLNNGAIVSLIGIEPSQEGESLLSSYVGEKVYILPDNSQTYDVNSMEPGTKYPAYLLLKSGGHLNRELLVSGTSELRECAPLVDSLVDFRRWYAEGKKHGVTPTPAPPQVINYQEDDIVLPPYQASERRVSGWFVDGNENVEMLEDACDYNLPYTKKFANELAAKSPGPYNIGQVCEIFDYCYNKWRYVNDPADIEYVARASESINASLTGDCDDFAVLVASCILAVGGRPCINTGHNARGGHAFTEVDIARFDQNEVMNTIRKHFSAYNISSLATRRDGDHLWLNLDWQAAYPGGPYYDCSRSRDAYVFEDGSWVWKKLN